MKKFWKISVCSLAVAFTLPAVTACEKGETEEKSNITADQVLALGDSIQSSLAGVQSFQFGMSMKSGESGPEYSMENGLTLTALMNVTKDGVSAKLSGTQADKLTVHNMPQYNYDRKTSSDIYILDGFAYVQDDTDEKGKTYQKNSVQTLLETLFEGSSMDFSQMLEEIMESQGQTDFEMPAIPTDLVQQVLTDEFTLIKKGDTTRVTLDLKKEYNDTLGYVGGWSLQTKVGDIVNYALGQFNEDLTWQGLSSLLKDKGGYKVSTIVNLLETAITNASGMSLQEIKDVVLAQPEVYEMLVQKLGSEETDAIVAASVSDLLDAYGNLTVNDLAKQATKDETATLASVIEEIETKLSTVTLGDSMDEDEKESFDDMMSIIRGIHVDAWNANLIFTVKNDTLTRVEVSYNTKITTSMMGMNSTTYTNYSMYAENFSGEKLAITLPTDITVDIYCADCGWSVTDDDYCDDCKEFICENCHAAI